MLAATYPHRALVKLVLLIGAIAILLSGCGNKDKHEPEALSAVDLGRSTLANCLKQNGASFATSSNDLAFFPGVDDDVSKFGIYYDKSADPHLFVDLWEDGFNPQTWLMWSAQPFEEDRSPLEIADAVPSHSYVAYVLHPTRYERHKVESCIAFSTPQERRSPVILGRKDFEDGQPE